MRFTPHLALLVAFTACTSPAPAPRAAVDAAVLDVGDDALGDIVDVAVPDVGDTYTPPKPDICYDACLMIPPGGTCGGCCMGCDQGSTCVGGHCVCPASGCTVDAVDAGEQPDGEDVGPCPNGFINIDFPCSKDFECLGNTTFRTNTTLNCEQNGYDPKCCSGMTCQQGGPQACPDGTLCIDNTGWGLSACMTKNCGGPGGATCAAGYTCRLPAGSCDPAVTMGVCVTSDSVAGLPPCVSCTDDCVDEGSHCEGGQIVQCKEVGGCFKKFSFPCTTQPVCAGAGLCLPKDGWLGGPCGAGGTCGAFEPYDCVGGGSGLCTKSCATCSGGTCNVIVNGCEGFGPGGDGQCVGPLSVSGKQIAVCAIPCTKKGECPSTLACTLVNNLYQGKSTPMCLPVGF